MAPLQYLVHPVSNYTIAVNFPFYCVIALMTSAFAGDDISLSSERQNFEKRSGS